MTVFYCFIIRVKLNKNPKEETSNNTNVNNPQFKGNDGSSFGSVRVVSITNSSLTISFFYLVSVILVNETLFKMKYLSIPNF